MGKDSVRRGMEAMQKWSYRDKEYQSYNPPKEWNTPLLIEDVSGVVNCASCGKQMVFGNGYTSRTIHNDYGMGYCVCLECYEGDIREEKWYREANENMS